jgi:uncharacterized protein YhdP
VLAIEPNAGLSGRLSLVRSGAGWEFHNGRVYFLEAGTRVAQVTLPREPGLHVQLRAQQFDVDRWLRLLPAAVPTTATTAAPAAPWLARVDLEARQAVALERRFHQLVFGLQHAAGTWRGTVAADELNGTWRWVEGTPVGRLEANLERLALGERDAIDAGAPLTDPRHLPTLSLQAQSFSWLGHDLGRLDFEASHAATGWSIDGLLLERPEARLVGHGMWRRVADAESTELDVQLTSRDMGQTLAALGYAGQMESGEIEMKGKFGWPSAPGEPRLDRLNGRLELQGENGRFVQVQTGAAGRFLGVVDLSSIGRLLLGDFGSVFGKGFTFDKLHGTITIDDGNAYTRDLSIKGPAAKVTVDGRVALASEQFDLVLDIEPSLGVTVPLLALPFLGPQGAAIVYGLQKLLGDPLSRGTRVTYAVKGPWKNPSVSKSGKWKEETKTPEPAEAPASSGG